MTSTPESPRIHTRSRLRSIGSAAVKINMALTGLVMFTFVAFHLYNNVHIYLGREAYNLNGFAWKTPGTITTVRSVLLVAVTLHILGGITLAIKNSRSRPSRYHVHRFLASTRYGRAMIITGLIAALYILYHVLHAKVGVTNPDLFSMVDEAGRRDVYNIIVISFQQPFIAGAYLLGLAGLFLHIAHGISSASLTLGITSTPNSRIPVWVGAAISFLLFIGYASLPFFVLTGLLEPKL